MRLWGNGGAGSTRDLSPQTRSDGTLLSLSPVAGGAAGQTEAAPATSALQSTAGHLRLPAAARWFLEPMALRLNAGRAQSAPPSRLQGLALGSQPLTPLQLQPGSRCQPPAPLVSVFGNKNPEHQMRVREKLKSHRRHRRRYRRARTWEDPTELTESPKHSAGPRQTTSTSPKQEPESANPVQAENLLLQ